MTARDAATEAGPTDEVEAAPVAGAPAESAAGDTADAEAATAPSAPDAADAAPTDDATAPEAGGRRKGRRRRRAAGEEPTSDATAGADVPADDAPAGPRRRTRRLLAVGLVVAVLFAAATAGLWYVRRPAPIAGLTSSQQSAVTAATQAAINLQTFRRASFDQDFANALATLTPEFAQQQLAPRKDALKQQLDQGGRDATAKALSAGLVSSTSSQAVVLVVTTTTQTADDGTSTPFVFSRLQLTLQLQGGKWLVSDLSSVGLS